MDGSEIARLGGALGLTGCSLGLNWLLWGVVKELRQELKDIQAARLKEKDDAIAQLMARQEHD